MGKNEQHFFVFKAAILTSHPQPSSCCGRGFLLSYCHHLAVSKIGGQLFAISLLCQLLVANYWHHLAMLISVPFLDRPSLCSIQCNIFSLFSSPGRVSTNISCNGLLPLVYHSRPQRLAFLMLRSAVDLCRCNKPRLPSQKTPTDANNTPCRSQKPFHCRKKPPQHCRKKPPNADRRKKPPNQPPVAKNPCYRRKKPEALIAQRKLPDTLTCTCCYW